jgi:hypothetical protein
MDKPFRSSVFGVIACVTSALLACGETSQIRSQSIVPIVDVKAVAGKWKGLLKETPPPPPLRYGGDRVTFIIKENGPSGAGTFQFASYRTIGVFSGSGPLHLDHGKLKSESEKGRTTYSLHERDGKEILIVDAQDKKGIQYHAEMTRAEAGE